MRSSRIASTARQGWRFLFCSAALAMLSLCSSGGCHSDAPPGDQQHYLRALQVAAPTSLAPCAPIEDPDLKGDCQLALAERSRKASQLCGQIQAEPWRSECWFSASEGARDAHKLALAVSCCQQAGPFMESCSQHLWQADLQAVLRANPGRGFTPSQPAAEALYRKWMTTMEGNMGTRFWTVYIRSVLQAGQATGADCLQLPSVYQTLCINIAVQQQRRFR